MKKRMFLFGVLALLTVNVQAQETEVKEPSQAKFKPKVGRYLQFDKETAVELCKRHRSITVRVGSVDVLNEKEMRVNLIISNPSDKQCIIERDNIKDSPIFIIDENATKYRPLQDLEADWDTYEYYNTKGFVLAPTERVKGTAVFPVLVEGARKFDLFIGHRALPVKDIQLIE